MSNSNGEVATAPPITLEHSGGVITAWNIAYWKPSRMIAVISIHSAAILPPAWDAKANVNGVLILGISGEYESWGDPNPPLETHRRRLRGRLVEYRSSQHEALISILVLCSRGSRLARPKINRKWQVNERTC